MDYRAALICGIDMPIPECKLIAHQPKIEEIAFIGEKDFFIGVQGLCINKSMFSQDKTVLADISNFQVFMTIMSEKEAKDQKDIILKVLKLIFPDYQIAVTPKSLLFVNKDGSTMVDENNFDAFQNVLKLIFCAKDGPMDQQAFNPGNEQAREIAKKLMRGRERVAAEKGSSNSSVFSQYLSILTIGIGSMSIFDLMKLTMFQLYDLIERFTLHMSWDLDIKQRLAGGKPEKEADNWMKNLH